MDTAATNTTLLVRKDELTTTVVRNALMGALDPGCVRVEVDRFALTSNNITYAAMGEAMQYWRFFPPETTSDELPWGCIPVWGFGTISVSDSPALPVGERIYGYFPMARYVDLAPTKVSSHAFFDGAPHRVELHSVYNQYQRCQADPFYTAQTEDVQALLRPLFITSWLIDDFLADNDFFGAAANAPRPVCVLLSSASSKTAYGTAFQLAQRSGVEVVGLTSPGNVAFCESLGCFHRVLTYDQIAQIDADAPCVYVDFAGNAAFRRALHTHCQRLCYSSSIGATHVLEMGGAKDVPGPKPTLFFAPAQIKKRSAEWGAHGLNERLVQSWHAFAAQVTQAQPPWLQVQHHRGAQAALVAYQHVLSGKGDPRVGHMLSM